MTGKTRRPALMAPAAETTENDLIVVNYDDNLVFENENIAWDLEPSGLEPSGLDPMEQLAYYERYAQRLGLQEVTSKRAKISTGRSAEDLSAKDRERLALAAFVHLGSRRYLH